MYSRILVPVDGSPPSLAGLKEAITLATDGGATIVVLNVASELPLATAPEGFVAYREFVDALSAAGRAIVKEAGKEVEKAGVKVESLVLDVGMSPVSDAIVEQIGRQRCDLVVMGTHGRRGLKRLTLGSDAELVVRQSPVPVLLVKAPPAAK
ncbi:MAG TPA: universal stress protein [Burkholderiaceae bacterium]